MNSPIPYLDDFLLICASLFPTGIGGLLAIPFQRKARQSIFYSLIGMIIAYLIIIILILIVKTEKIIIFHSAPLHFYLLAPLVGVMALVSEYSIGVYQLYLKTGKLTLKLSVHSAYSSYTKISLNDITIILVFVMLEELVLRQFFVLMFLHDFHWNVWVTIILSAIIYALNHITFGYTVVVQKIASSLLYTTLYYVSGLAILVPIIAHATQNLILLAVSRIGGKHE